MKDRVLLIGIDSADFEQVKRLRGIGKLPNLNAFSDALIPLPSTIPPHTAPSWTSMLTAANPGKHGVYYFKNIHTNRVLSSSDVKMPYVWERLSEEGLFSIVFNVPLTYPVRKFNGIMVSGLHATVASPSSVYPESFLPSVIESYRFDMGDLDLPTNFSHDPNSTYEQLLQAEQSRVSLFCRELLEPKWDFACIVLTSLDRIQHYYWSMEKGISNELGKFVENAYQRIDSFVGEILTTVNEVRDLSILVASDHGFEEKSEVIYPNSILAREGLLLGNEGTNHILEKVRKYTFEVMGPKLPAKLTRLVASAGRKVAQNLFSSSSDLASINKRKSLAYCSIYGLTSINLSDRSRDGIVHDSQYSKYRDQTRKALTQPPFLLDVVSSDEAYWGPNIKDAPDLIILPKRTLYYSHGLNDKIIEHKATPDHSSQGVLLLSRKIKTHSQNFKELRVWDIGSTILALMGYRIPNEIDGISLLATESKSLRELSASKNPPLNAQSAYTEEEERIIREKLKGMGYE